VAGDSGKKAQLIQLAREGLQSALVSLRKKPDSKQAVTEKDVHEELISLDQEFGGIIPLSAPAGKSVRMTSDIGFRFHPIKKKRLMHTGIDFAQRGCNGWDVISVGLRRICG